MIRDVYRFQRVFLGQFPGKASKGYVSNAPDVTFEADTARVNGLVGRHVHVEVAAGLPVRTQAVHPAEAISQVEVNSLDAAWYLLLRQVLLPVLAEVGRVALDEVQHGLESRLFNLRANS